jgi:hypothetical protein
MPPDPLGRLRRGLGINESSAKQNKRFCFFSGKEVELRNQLNIICEVEQTDKYFWGQSQTPWIRSAEDYIETISYSTSNFVK